MNNLFYLFLATAIFACAEQSNQEEVADVATEEKAEVSKDSYHIHVDSIPQNPDSGFTNVYNKGGMSIGYINIPQPMDFSSLLKGLPHDLCNSPHWGYVIDGSVRIIYHDGKQDTVTAGEVFYWPELHTGIVDDSVKLVDFSPDDEFIPLMKHIGSVLAESEE